MYPNQPLPPPYQPPQGPPTPPPVDYLNQIAPQTQQKKLLDSGPKKLIFFLGIATILVIILVVIINVFSGTQRQPVEQLSAKLSATAQVAADAQPYLKSSALRGLNSDLRVYFTNTNRDIAQPLQSVKIDVAKISKDVSEQEAAETAAMTKRLEDARLNVIYDRTYAREMAYRLATLLALMQQIYGSTDSASLREYLKGAYDNLVPMQKGFSDFNESGR